MRKKILLCRMTVYRKDFPLENIYLEHAKYVSINGKMLTVNNGLWG